MASRTMEASGPKAVEPGGDPADPQAELARLYERHRREVFGFLLGLVRDRALAEDLLQESFVRLSVSLERYDPSRPFRPWMFQIVRNAALDALRRRRKEAGQMDEDDAQRGPAQSIEVLASLEEGERRTRMRAALEAIPDESRAILVQHHWLGMKQADLADSLACSERTVRNRLRAAAEQLAQAFLRTKGETR